jgi:ubiquinone/menaquinone biosynthesis C-methylase UbiE
VHETLNRLHGGQRGNGTTISRFRLNEVGSQIAFGGRRRRVYRRVTGVDPSQAAIAHARRRALPTMTFTVGVAQDLDLPDATFDVVTSTLAIHHVPARKREAAFREMYRVTRPGGRLLVADFDPSRRPLPLHRGGRRMRQAAATVGPLEDLAAAAGYRVESAGQLPLLRYVLAIRPEEE